MEPNLPYGTRVQTLQMVSTLFAPPAAESCIQEAASILARLDQRNFQVQLLTGDNEKMQRDLDDVQGRNGVDKDGKTISRFAEEALVFDRVLEEQREIARAAEEEVESWGPEDTDLVFFPDDGGEHRRAQEDKEAQITKFQEEVVARKKQRLQFGEAQAERLDPGYSIFSGVSAVQDENAGASFQDSSFFSGLSDADGTSPQASPGESMIQDGSRSGTSATGRPHTSASSRPGTSAGNRRDTSIGGDIAGINTILAKDSAAHEAATTEAATTKAATAKANEAAINTARAQVEAGRMELAALESKLTAIREDKTADVVQHLPIRSNYPAVCSPVCNDSNVACVNHNIAGHWNRTSDAGERCPGRRRGEEGNSQDVRACSEYLRIG